MLTGRKPYVGNSVDEIVAILVAGFADVTPSFLEG